MRISDWSSDVCFSDRAAKGPIWSRLDAKAMRPDREMRPKVGLAPTTPHRAAGWRMEPPVSEPREMGAKPAATAAADPREEPPGPREVSSGFRVGPKAELSVELPMATSSRLVLPTTTAPASWSRRTTRAWFGGRQLARSRDET